jgi:glycosyltransferase involved in cell wall biosynthesis
MAAESSAVRMPPPVSAVMITYNAARCLPAVLAALAWCAEIVVVDSGSTDETLAIAAAHDCRVLHRPFDGFGPQKRFAVAQAHHAWVLAVDADEIITPALAAEIQHRLAADAGRYTAYWVPRTLVFLGRAMRGAEYKMPHLRLFDRRHGTYNLAPVHEEVEMTGALGRLNHHMLHDSYADLSTYLLKFNQYTTAAATELHRRGKRVSAVAVAVRFPLAFLQQYVLKGNFLNGYPGLIWALLSALYPVMKYAKLRELMARAAATG